MVDDSLKFIILKKEIGIKSQKPMLISQRSKVWKQVEDGAQHLLWNKS